MLVHIFDCDGVITDTNDLKTEAFKKISKDYLPINCQKLLLDYHYQNGGKSRWDKFEFVKDRANLRDLDVDYICIKYGEKVEELMYKKKLIPGIRTYVESIADNEKEHILYVASAGEINQVKRLLKFNKLEFDLDNVFGAPQEKVEIMNNIKAKNHDFNYIVYGDSPNDARCATSINAKFVFVYGYTNTSFEDIKKYTSDFLSIKDFSSLNVQEIIDLFS